MEYTQSVNILQIAYNLLMFAWEIWMSLWWVILPCLILLYYRNEKNKKLMDKDRIERGMTKEKR
jgi:hypothetical protein